MGLQIWQNSCNEWAEWNVQRTVSKVLWKISRFSNQNHQQKWSNQTCHKRLVQEYQIIRRKVKETILRILNHQFAKCTMIKFINQPQCPISTDSQQFQWSSNTQTNYLGKLPKYSYIKFTAPMKYRQFMGQTYSGLS